MATKSLIVRGDDFGMCHGANQGTLRALKEGILTCATVMAPCPWFFEAAQIARDNPDLEVGLHITLACEWRLYRWRPVAGSRAVPSLVRSDGTFHATVEELAENLTPEDVRTEVTAQLELALENGIDIPFMDMHIGVGRFPEVKAQVDEICNEIADAHDLVFEAPSKLKLGPVGYYTQPVEGRIEHVKKRLLEEGPDLRMMLAHPGTHSEEMAALRSLNPVVQSVNQAENRGADVDMLCDPALREFLDENKIRLVGLKEMIEKKERESP